MALQTSGPISIDDIVAEFGGSSPDSLTEYYGAASGVPSSGAISIADFYGTSSAIPISASGGTTATGGGYKYHRFTSSGTFTVHSTSVGGYSNTLEVFVVGAGAGGRANGSGSGGGGAAAIRTVSASVGGKTVTVGQGGLLNASRDNGKANDGGSSGFSGVASSGGGKGGNNRGRAPVHSGGAGGAGHAGGLGAHHPDGWNTGTGGSANRVGAAVTNWTSPKNGVAGYSLSGWTTSTSRTQYGGSGGGSYRLWPGTLMKGGSGSYGGGAGPAGEYSQGGTMNGAANSGGSGGAGAVWGGGGDGGSGVVIIRYQV